MFSSSLLIRICCSTQATSCQATFLVLSKFVGHCYRGFQSTLFFLMIASLTPMGEKNPLHPSWLCMCMYLIQSGLFLTVSCYGISLFRCTNVLLKPFEAFCFSVSTVPSQPDKLFSNPEKLKGLSKSVPSFLQEEVSSISEMLQFQVPDH